MMNNPTSDEIKSRDAKIASLEEKNNGTAKWVLGRRGRRIVCSNCETPVPFHKDGKRNYFTAWYSPYCPKCGKQMTREKEEGLFYGARW